MTPLVIDVDTGIDDAFGLLYALAAPKTNIVGVSTVAGNVSLSHATRNTRAVLALAGRADIPVWPGVASPLLQSARDASDIHGASGLGYAALPEPPLAIARDPDLPRRLQRFVAMGGAFACSGNVTAAAEFNIWHDPEAASLTFRAFSQEDAAPAILVGLDVTRQTVLTEADLDGLAAASADAPRGPALTGFLRDAARYYFELMERRGRKRALVMHDPLAVAVALDPTLVRLTMAPVDVETRGELTRGLTLADFRGETGPIGVALEVDAERFRAEYLAAIERLARADK